MSGAARIFTGKIRAPKKDNEPKSGKTTVRKVRGERIRRDRSEVVQPALFDGAECIYGDTGYRHRWGVRPIDVGYPDLTSGRSLYMVPHGVGHETPGRIDVVDRQGQPRLNANFQPVPLVVPFEVVEVVVRPGIPGQKLVQRIIVPARPGWVRIVYFTDQPGPNNRLALQFPSRVGYAPIDERVRIQLDAGETVTRDVTGEFRTSRIEPDGLERRRIISYATNLFLGRASQEFGLSQQGFYISTSSGAEYEKPSGVTWRLPISTRERAYIFPYEGAAVFDIEGLDILRVK